MEITALGDSALVVQVCTGEERNPERCITLITKAVRRLEVAPLPGLVEIAPAFTSVGVFFDPARLTSAAAPGANAVEALKSAITAALRGIHGGARGAKKSRLMEVPVCYDGEFAPDISEVARHAQMSPAAVLSLHAAATYRVRCIGFTPGFPYLAGLPEALATPRRSIPRKQVAAGSVAIGGAQAGIYPQQSPGGWNIIGRTPLRLFDPDRRPPSLFAMGDTLRVRPITREEFDRLT